LYKYTGKGIISVKGIEFMGLSLKVVRGFPTLVKRVASFPKKIYVLHAFQKKTQKMGRQHIETAKRALKKVLERECS